LEPVFGKDGVDRMADLIATHQGSDINWQQDPVGSSLRVADNMALFEKEKAPPIARYVSQTVPILEEMKLDPSRFGELKQELDRHVDEANLPQPMKDGLHQAVAEIFPGSPKFTLGMFAGESGRPTFDGKTLDIPVYYNDRAATLQEYFDLGQRQFLKFAESYGVDEEEAAHGEFAAKDTNGEILLHAHVVGAPRGVFKWVWANGGTKMFRIVLPEISKEAQLHAETTKTGNAEHLISWYNDGADGQIDWGSDGDWQQCVDVASKYMSEDQAKGFCELRHQDATGMSTSEHAHKDKEGK
jgi:hypothetical protein